MHVVPEGELDLATAPTVDRQLEQLRDAGVHTLVLDLARVTFMDLAGLRLVLRWSEAARRNAGRFAVIPGPRRVQRLFEMTATGDDVRFLDPRGACDRRFAAPPRRRGTLSRPRRA